MATAAIAAMLAGCGGPDRTGPGNDADAADEPVLNLPAVPLPEPPLDRAALLAAVAQAASAAASGDAQRSGQRELDGRQFELRIRFGCRGPVPEGEERWLGWSFDAEQRRLSVKAQPTIRSNEALPQPLDEDAFEAIEGFWIPRPWLLQPACPAAAAVKPTAEASTDEAKAPATEQPATPLVGAPRVGIAQFFTEADPRSARRDGRAYEFVRTLDEGTPLGSAGFNLVLSGRLRALPGRGVMLCTPKGPDTPPDCIVSADFDRVWIERPGSREVIAEWRTS